MKPMIKYATLLFLSMISCTRNHEPDTTHHSTFNDRTEMDFNSIKDTEDYSRREYIYGRVYGTALTMDVFTPKKASKGRAVILFISEGWYSEREKTEYNIPIYINHLIKDGYTVFAVIHGSNPKFSLQENYEHAKRAVRFVRYHAKEFGIDSSKIGAIGDSAGGHLSLLVGSDKNTESKISEDPIEQESCKVQAVVAFFPPTDFFNWGEAGHRMLGNHPKVPLKGAFTFYELDSLTNSLELVSEQIKIDSIVKELSPIYQVNPASAPTLIVYGDEDSFIPIQQSQSLARRLQELKVVVNVIVEKGGEHDENTIMNNIDKAISWFDKYLN